MKAPALITLGLALSSLTVELDAPTGLTYAVAGLLAVVFEPKAAVGRFKPDMPPAADPPTADSFFAGVDSFDLSPTAAVAGRDGIGDLAGFANEEVLGGTPNLLVVAEPTAVSFC